MKKEITKISNGVNRNKIKILISGFIVLISGLGFYQSAGAAGVSVYVSPATLSKNVGESFNLSVGVSGGEKVCVVEGKLNLDKLSCQSVNVEDGVRAQSSPSCNNLYFLIGIPGCTTNNKTLFTINVKAESAGAAAANFTGIDIIGEGVSVSSASVGGNYILSIPTPVCNCTWGSWRSGICGGGNCPSTQRLQTRTKTCTPAGCNVESESQCIKDSSCVPPVEKGITSPGKDIIPSKEEITPEEGTITEPEEVTEEEKAMLPKKELTFLAAIGNILSFGTGKLWLSVAIEILILLVLVFAIAYFIKKARGKKTQ